MEIRIGVLGCASIAKRRVIPAILQANGLDLAAVASRTRAKADSFAEEFNCESVLGYDQLLEREDLDAVYIPLPTGLHEEWSVKALSSGKHVFLEKSSTVTLESAQRIVAAAKSNNRLVLENFGFEYHSQLEFVKNKLSEGTIGDLRCLRSSFGFPAFGDSENIRYKKELGGGALLDAGTYTLKCARIFLGNNIRTGGAFLFPKGEDKVDLQGGAILSNESGVIAEVAFGFDNYYQCNFELWGSKGKITVARAFTAGPEVSPTIRIEKNNEAEEFPISCENQFVNILNVFHRSIGEGEFEKHYNEIIAQATLIDEVRACAIGKELSAGTN